MGSANKMRTTYLTILRAIKIVINKKKENNSVTVKQKQINRRYQRYIDGKSIEKKKIRFDLDVIFVTLY